MSKGQQLGLALILLGWVAILAVMFGGCNHGSEIPIDPSQCELDPSSYGCPEFDVCAEVGVEECAPECDTCEVCPPTSTVYLCKRFRLVCDKTGNWGHNHDNRCGHCRWDVRWEECEGPRR